MIVSYRSVPVPVSACIPAPALPTGRPQPERVRPSGGAAAQCGGTAAGGRAEEGGPAGLPVMSLYHAQYLSVEVWEY